MSEQWRPVSGYVGVYEVSDFGRLRRVTLKRKQTKLGDYVKTPSRQPHGYLQYVLCYERKIVSYLAHRLVWEAFCGSIPDGAQINHLNGVKDDNRLSNLELCTRSENMIHAIHTLKCRRRDQRGERNNEAKLTDEKVRAIRASLKGGAPGWRIAKEHAVSQATVSYIKNGKRWTQVT